MTNDSDFFDGSLNEASRQWLVSVRNWLDSGNESDAGSDPVILSEKELLERFALVRRGMLLRRRWDRETPEAEDRRRLLRWLTAAQSRLQGAIHRFVRNREGEAVSSVESVLREQIAQDDRYLKELLDDSGDDECRTAFAIAAFRDDLHWSGSLITLFEQGEHSDFIARILLEQKVLNQQLQTLREAPRDATEAASLSGEKEAVDTEDPELRESVDRLQIRALMLQVKMLEDGGHALSRKEESPNTAAEVQGHFQGWMVGSRLLSRFDSLDVASEEVQEDLQRARRQSEKIRERSYRHWRTGLSHLVPEEKREAFGAAFEELSDRVGETVTFLEELPMAEGVKALRVLEEDLNLLEDAFEDMKQETSCRKSCRTWRRALRSRRRTVAGELQERQISSRLEAKFGYRFVSFLERSILVLLLLFCVMLILERPLIEWFSSRTGKTSVSLSSAAKESVAHEHSTDSSQTTFEHFGVEAFFAWLDLLICSVFLFDFFLKWSFAERRWLFVRRNWLTGLLPSIPVGFLIYILSTLPAGQVTGGATWIVAIRFLRYLRLPRMARWLRIARPVLRGFRLFAFSLRASDRLVRQMAPILNREIILFESLGVSKSESSLSERFQTLRESFYYRASDTYRCLKRRSRNWLIRVRCDDLSTMLSAPLGTAGGVGARWRDDSQREIPVEQVISRLLSTNPALLSDRIGLNLAESIARWCKALDVAVIRRFPLARDLVAAAKLPDPFETTAYAANRVGVFFQWLLDRVYWFSDLYGIITAPQLVDSIGQYMVKGAMKPAKRLVLVGLGLLAISNLAQLIPHDMLTDLAESLERVFGWPVVILGLICFVFLGIGAWLRRIAGEATELYSQVAEAQFIDGTLQYKQQVASRQKAFLRDRVFGVTDSIEEEDSTAKAGTPPNDRAGQTLLGMRDGEPSFSSERIVDQLWEDYLLGSPLNANDTRTPTQLLGNPVLISLRENRLALSKKEKKRIGRLDLENNQFSFRGPYLWFHFICHSLEQQSAKLVLAYNRFLIPMERGGKAEDWQIYRHVRWLCHRTGKSFHDLRIPAVLIERYRKILETSGDEIHEENHTLSEESLHRRFENVPEPARLRHWFESDDFNTLHFLLSNAAREREVEHRYGAEVLALLLQDRRNNIRRAFSTYPMDRWPKDRRTINPLTFYNSYLAGGKVILFPFRVLIWMSAMGWNMFFTFLKFVREVLKPAHVQSELWEDADSIEVARRKILRMCKPLFMEALSLRAKFDPEYLGVQPVPGFREGAFAAEEFRASHSEADRPANANTDGMIEGDLKKIGAPYHLIHQYRKLVGERQRQMVGFRKWRRRLSWTTENEASIRAMAVAYTIDYRDLRTVLEAADALLDLFQSFASDPENEIDRVPRSMLRRVFRLLTWKRRRTKRQIRRLLSHPLFREISETSAPRDAFLAAVLADPDRWEPLLKKVVVAGKRGESGVRKHLPLDAALQVFRSAGEDPGPWNRQLIVLRTVQTLSVLDLENYLQLVRDLGQYTCSEQG